MTLRFKTVLNPLIQGVVPQYRAIVINNGVVDIDTLSNAIAEECGLKPAVVKSVIELFFEQIGYEFKNGMRLNLEQMEGGLAIQGTAKASNEPWSAGNLKLVSYLNSKGALKNPFKGITPVNVTDVATVIVRRVLDVVYEQDGFITGTADVQVFVAGDGLNVNPASEDEGCWLADYATERIVATGTVTASTATTLDVTFASLPADGTYWLVVASRGGRDSTYGVAIGRRKVTVKADPDATEEEG